MFRYFVVRNVLQKTEKTYLLYLILFFHLYTFADDISFDRKNLFTTSEKEGYFSPDGNYLLHGSRSIVPKYRVLKWHYFNY